VCPASADPDRRADIPLVEIGQMFIGQRRRSGQGSEPHNA
jgi:hypothetical protein